MFVEQSLTPAPLPVATPPAAARWLARFCILLALVAFGTLALMLPAQLQKNASLTIRDAWARSTAPDAEVAAAYATVHNDSAQTLVLHGVRTDAADSAEIHEMSMDGGVMRMRHLDSVSLAPGETLQLEPGGVHLMLFGLRHPLRAGETLLLHFLASDGREISIAAPIRDSAS